MNARSAFLLIALLAVPLQVSFADERADAWVAKARAALGGEKALTGICAVRFSGTVETIQKIPSKDDPTKMVETPIRLAIDISFQKPYRQRIVLRSDKTVETTALDDYIGWIRRAEIGRENQAQLTLLESSQIKRLRAKTWDELSFYRGIEARGGRMDYQGEADVDGKTCVVLAFVHAPTIIFTRYFDKTTGLLLKTVTENGGEIREEGEIIVAGIRYPKVLINKSPDGQVATITFDRIKVNEPLPDAEFDVPDAVIF
jgi:hypothetical protein